MAVTQLTEVDFDQIKNNLIQYLKSTNQFSDYDFSGSNLQVILNLIAFTSQLNSYTANMVANEAILASSSIRNNVVMNAKTLGYTPSSEKAASISADIEFTLDPLDYPDGYPQFMTLTVGPVFTTAAKKESFTFNLLEDQVSSVTGQGKCFFRNIVAYEGIYLNQEFIVDNTIFDQKFILQNSLIDASSIRVEVQEDPNIESNQFYDVAKNITSLTPDSRVYWIDEISENNYEIIFGDGLFGKKLRNGAKIFVSYLVTNGKLANGIRTNYAFIGRIFDSFGTRIVETPILTVSESSSGGSDLESVPSIKFRAPKSYSAQDRCVTAADYESKVRQIYPSVDDVYAFGGEILRIPEYGRVYVVIKPISGVKLSNTTKEFIKNALNDFRIASLDIKIVDPEVLYVEVDSTIYFDSTKTVKDAASIQSLVKSTLIDYSNSSNLSKFGGVMKYSRIIAAIDDADLSITRNNSSLRMRRDIKILPGTRASYEICFENEILRNSTSAVVWSTGFQLVINGILDSKTYYMEDDGNGNMVLFYLDSEFSKIVTDKNFGTIDYDLGEIKIGYVNPITFANTTIGNSIIEIRSKPQNQDIESIRIMYLDLDVSKSDIEVVIDQKRERSESFKPCVTNTGSQLARQRLIGFNPGTSGGSSGGGSGGGSGGSGGGSGGSGGGSGGSGGGSGGSGGE